MTEDFAAESHNFSVKRSPQPLFDFAVSAGYDIYALCAVRFEVSN